MSYLRSLFCSTHKCNDLTLVRASRPSGASRPCLCAAPLARHRRPTVSDMLFREPNTQHVTHQNRMALRFWSLRKLPRHAGTRLHTSVSNWLSRVQPPKPTHVDCELPFRVLLLFSSKTGLLDAMHPLSNANSTRGALQALSPFARMAHHTGRYQD